MARKYIKYQAVETGEIRILYQDENPYLYNLTLELYGEKELPVINLCGNIKFLEFGENDG